MKKIIGIFIAAGCCIFCAFFFYQKQNAANNGTRNAINTESVLSTETVSNSGEPYWENTEGTEGTDREKQNESLESVTIPEQNTIPPQKIEPVQTGDSNRGLFWVCPAILTLGFVIYWIRKDMADE